MFTDSRMWRSRMFWQLFGTFSVLLLLSLGLLGFMAGRQTERNEIANLEERLRAKALLLAELIRDRPGQGNQDLVERLTHLSRDLPTRITLIAQDGKVLAETAKDPEQLENHGDRPEVVQAIQNGWGRALRPSSTAGERMMYLALKTEPANSEVAIVRVALPVAGIEAKVRQIQGLVWAAAALTAFMALAGAFWLAHRFSRPLRDLIEGAEQIAAGGYGHHVYVEGRDEMGRLALTFNHMSERLAQQFNQLDEDRQQLRTVLSGMVEGVVAIDAEQHILFANERAGQLLNFPTRQVIGRPLWEIVRQRPLQEIVQRALVEGQCDHQDLPWTGPGKRSLSVHVARLPGQPPRGAVLVVHDITELRRLERLRREFVANVSHELKTPLAIITACVETLIDGGADDSSIRGQFLERIAEQSHRLHDLILDLLRLARIESETEAFTRETLELSDLVSACQERHRTLAEGKKQVLLISPPPADQPPALAFADEEAIQQILDNLVDNALKYTPEGGAVRVRWGREANQVFLEVKDTGIGIAEAELPRIFERFYRVDKARSRELGGTGLGLSIVKHLAQAMQGSVKAESRPGGGSTFTVYLPAVNGQA